MSLDDDIFALLGPLVANRCYPDTLPDEPTFPCIVYQQVGGVATDFMDQALPSLDNARVQVRIFSRTRAEANTLARSVRTTLLGSTLQVKTLGMPVSTYDKAPYKIYGSRTDYSIWHAP